MKYKFIAVMLFATCCILACRKDNGTVQDTPGPIQNTGNPGRSSARYASPGYSQHIPLDTANSMIQSYLSSVRYPYADTALRSLTFDADTLRSYLLNNRIVTLKLVLAHQPAYKNSSNGKYSGMRPEALTLIVVGLDENGQYVLNNRNGVYEHMAPCPNHCPGNGSALIN